MIWIGQSAFEATPDRILVLQDEFRSGYECQTCFDREHQIKRGGLDGETISVIPCDNCNGSGHYMKGENEIRCSICEGTGRVVCPDCKGKGSLTVVIPEKQKGDVTTGIIVSLGENIKNFKLGQRVVYQSFSGHRHDLVGVDDLGRPVQKVLVWHIDRDLLGYVHGKQLAKRMVKQSAALHTLA